MEKLVALDAIKMQQFPARVFEEYCIDFVATTTANLGVPYPSLSRGISFDSSLISTPNDCRERKSDE